MIFAITLISCQHNEPTPSLKEYTDSLMKSAQVEIKDIDSKITDSIEKYNSIETVESSVELQGRLAALKSKKDDFKAVEFYLHKNEPKGWANSIDMYIVKKGSEFYGRLKVGFTGSEWLFVNHYEFLCDGKKYQFTPYDLKKDNDSDVYEYSDDAFTQNIKRIVKAIIDSKETKMRYVGSDHYHDRVVGPSEKKRLAEVYKVLYNL